MRMKIGIDNNSIRTQILVKIPKPSQSFLIVDQCFAHLLIMKLI